MFSTVQVKKVKFHFNFLPTAFHQKSAEKLGPESRSKMSTANVKTRQKVLVFISFGVSIFDCFIQFEVEKKEIGNIRAC